MRRLAALTIAGALLLSACHRAGQLDAAEVLRRATAASAQLQSAAFTVHANLSYSMGPLTARATAQFQGTLAQGGHQSALTATVNGSTDRAGQHTSYSLLADLVNDVRDVYLNVHTLGIDPAPQGLQQSQPMLDTWWKISRGENALPGESVTPDPQFLAAQSAAVTVLQDHGLEQIDGRDAYRYTVSIDPEKLVALLKSSAQAQGQPFDEKNMRDDLAQYDARGEVWIDSETFFFHRISWIVTSKKDPSALQLQFTADISKQNAAPPVTIPEHAQEFQMQTLLQYWLPASGGSSSSSR